MRNNNNISSPTAFGDSDRERSDFDKRTDTGQTSGPDSEKHSSENRGLVRTAMGENSKAFAPNRTRRLYICALFAGILLVFGIYEFFALKNIKAKHLQQIEDAQKAQRTTERSTFKDAFFDYQQPNNATQNAPTYDPENREMHANKAVWVNN